MGRKKHSSKTSRDPTTPSDELASTSYKPRLIHSLTYEALQRSFLRMVPQDRNVFVSMCDYELNTINPQYENIPEAPTHIMIFAVRLIRDDLCQPIGGLFMYDYVDQSATLAECLKAYIVDLSMIGINVIGTVSRSSGIYKRIIGYLAKMKNFATYSGPITYSIPPFKDLVHIYDFAYITVMFQRQFRHSVVIKFIKDYKLMEASWDDILITLTSTNLFKPYINEALYNNLDIGFNIFTSEFAEKYDYCRKKNMLTESQETTWEIVTNIIKFTALLETDEIYVNKLMLIYNSLIELQKLLFSVSFRKNRGLDYNFNKEDRIDDTELTVSISSTTNDDDEEESGQESEGKDEDESSIRTNDEETEKKKVDFEDDPPIELEENCMQNILNLIDNSLDEKEITKDKVAHEKLLIKSNNCPYNTKPTVNNRKRRTKEDAKIDLLEKNFVGMDLHEKENVEKNNERNKEVRKKTKITNLLMEYLHSESYKNLEKSELASRIISENDIKSTKSDSKNNMNNVKAESQMTDLDSIDIINNLPKTKNNSTMKNQENFSLDNFTFDVKSMPDFVENYFCLKPIDKSEVTTDTSDVEEESSKNKNHFRRKRAAKGKSKFAEDSNFNEIPYISGESKTGNEYLIDTKEYLTCDTRQHLKERKCNVCLLKMLKEENFEEDEVAKDWLTAIGGLSKLSEVLESRRVKYVVPYVFTLEHMDYFVSLIQKRNEVPSSYNSRDYTFLNNKAAFQTLENEVGLYLIKKD